MALAFGNVGSKVGVGALAWALGAGLLVACDAQRTATPPNTVEIALPTLDGAQLSSTGWRGRTVVLNVWASWCAPCREEMASLEALSRAIDPAQVIVIGITVDEDRNLAREYRLRERISFPILSDVSQDVVKRTLGVHALPTTLVLGPDGALRARVAGAKNWTDPVLLEALSLPPLRSEPRAQLPRR